MADAQLPTDPLTPTTEAMPEEVYLETGGPTSPGGAGPTPGGSPATAPLASGIPGAPLEAQPPFSLEDLATAAPDYWMDLQRGFESGDTTTDDYYQTHRQRVLDEENPMLESIRGQQPPPAETAAPAAAPASEAPMPGPSTAEQADNWLSAIGIRGIQPLSPAGTLVEAAYAQNASKETDPIYLTLRRLATVLDTALTAVNIPITGVGDLANLVLAPLTVGLKAAGADKATVEGFIQGTRAVPEMAAAFGTAGAGLLGTLGKVGNLTGMGAELGPLLTRAGRVQKLEDSFAVTMRDVWKSERGEVRIPGPDGAPINPEILAADSTETLAKKYELAVIEARRGGPRTLEQVEAEGKALIDQGLVSMDFIRTIVPGTPLNDAQTWAVMRLLADEGLRLKVIAQRTLETGSAQDQAHLLEQFYTFSLALHPRAIGVEAEAGRTLHVWNDPVSGFKRFLTQFEEAARNKTKGVDAMTLARMVASFENPGQLSVFAKQALRPGFWDLFNEYYVNGLLWGPKTWMANVAGNSITTLWSLPERQLAAFFSLHEGGRGVAMDEAWQLLHGIIGGQLDAWRVAGKAFATGDSHYGSMVGDLVDKTELRRRAISSAALEMTGWPGAAVDLLGNTVRFPGRIMGATDDYFKAIAWMGEHRARASREATQEAAAKLAAGELKPKEIPAFVTQRYSEKMADPPETITKAAAEYALYQTFQKELGKTGQLITKLSNRPFGKVFVPIIRTPINMAKWAGERTPLMLFTAKFWREINGEDRAVAAMAKAKVAMGTGVLAIGANWYLNGLITGGGPADPKIRKDLYDNLNWRPYALRLGNTFIGINRLEPPGMLLTLGADFAEAMVNAPDDEEMTVDFEEAANAIAIAGAKAFTSRTMVKGLAETFTAMADPERAMESRLSSIGISLVPLSGLVRQGTQALDPTMREADGIMQRIRSQIFPLSTALPQRLTLDGDPVYMTGVWGPISVTQLKDDPTALERTKVGARVPEIPKAIRIGKNVVTLTGQERQYWTRERGKLKMPGDGMTLHEAQVDLMASTFYKESSDEVKAAELERVIRGYQKEAFSNTLEHYPNLERSIEDARDAAYNKRFGPPTPPDAPTTPLIKSLTR